jgi:transposase
LEALPLDCHQKKAQRLKAHLAFLDETGFMLMPNLRRTWAPRAKTPVVRHRYSHDRISAISVVTVSPRRRRLGHYLHFHEQHLSHTEVAIFLRYLLRQLRGHIVLLWDGGSIHDGPDIRALLARHPRLHTERFPAYAPELNPDEFAWAHYKHHLANGRPDNLAELLTVLCRQVRRARRNQALLRSFVSASTLPLFLGQ